MESSIVLHILVSYAVFTVWSPAIGTVGSERGRPKYGSTLLFLVLSAVGTILFLDKRVLGVLVLSAVDLVRSIEFGTVRSMRIGAEYRCVLGCFTDGRK